MFITDEVIEVGREGYFEEWFEDRVSVVGQTPEGRPYSYLVHNIFKIALENIIIDSTTRS